MTAVDNMQDVRREIDEFRRVMKQIFICFDPGDLEESYLPQKAQQNGLKNSTSPGPNAWRSVKNVYSPAGG